MKGILFFVVMLLSIIAYTQTTVTGVVTDESGQSLIGANVLVKGTSIGAVTDFDGNYSIDVPDGSGILVFSYTGFQELEITIAGQSTINVALAEGTTLDEIVVTALGIEKQSSTLGYSIDEVSGSDLTQARESNILNSLQGKVTGVNISNTSGNLGGSAKIIIRGVTSLSGRNDPLFVVDGIPISNNQTTTGSRITGNRDFGNGASVINPDDIATMSVLKGAAATALYGSRAAAGAIIITTKRGESNGGNAKVSINSSLRFDDLFITPGYQQDYAMGALNKYDSSSVGFDWGPRIVGQTVDNLPAKGGPGQLQAVEDNGVKKFFETGKSYINNLAISDASDRMDYRLSFGALNQTGIVPGSSLDRYNISLNAGVNHNANFSSRFGVQFINTNSEGTAAAGANDPNIIGLSSFSSNLDPDWYTPWIDDAGNQINNVTPTSNNPYWLRFENKNEREDNRVLANFSMTYNPFDNLSISGKVGYDYDQDNRLLTNRKGTAQRIDGNFIVDKLNRTQLNTDIIANYNTDLGESLTLSVLGGFNYNNRTFSRETLTSTSLLVPELFDPGNTAQNVPTRAFSEQVLFGLYGQAELGYKDFLTLSLTGRNDWSSTLPTNNNSYFYPSASAAFLFSNAFNISDKVLSYGKLRASYAQVGNDTGPYQLDFNFFPITTATGQYSLNINFPFNSRLAFAKSNTIPPENLKPESQVSYELGAELKFFDYRLGLDVTYFKSENTDQILALPIPETTGFGFLRTNVGQVNTSGWEITLDATPISTKNFRWETMVNFSNPKTEVVKLAEGVDRVLIASGFSSVQVVAEEGKGFELFAIPFLIDSASGRPLINPVDGTRQAGIAKTMGSVLPDFSMGFVNTFRLGNFSVTGTVDWRSGGVMKSSTVENLQTGGLVIETAGNRQGTFIDRSGVLDNGDGTVRENDIPLSSTTAFWQSIDDNSIAEPFIFDASYVKLRELAITYSLPESVLGSTFIRGASIGVEGRNVALLYSKVPHVDPENTLFGSGADGFGIERASTPSTRSLGFNLRLTF